MYCQPPLQSWGTFYLEKKGLIFLQRSTGRFSCGVSALLGRGGSAGRPAKCLGDREAWSLRACGGFISAAMPPPCSQEVRVHMRVDMAVSRVCIRVHTDGGLGMVAAAARSVSPPRPGLQVPMCSESLLSPEHPWLPSLSFYPGQEDERENLMEMLPSFPSFPVLCPSIAYRGTRAKGNLGLSPALHLSPESGVFFRVFFFHLRKL